jgi:hypothetical protein
MKYTYYRKSSSEYQKGYFISSEKIIGFLLFLGFLFLLYLQIIDTPDWIRIILDVIYIFIFLFYMPNIKDKYCVTTNSQKSSPNWFIISEYLSKIIKKKRGKTPISRSDQFPTFIGDNEFDSIVTYSQILKDFYEKCSTELDELKKIDIKKFNSVEIRPNETPPVHYHNSNGEINWEKLHLLKVKLKYRIDILEKINEIKKSIEIF